MRIVRTLVFALAVVAPVASGHADPRPEKDLKLQKENVEKLRENAAADRKAGNRVGAWAAERDEKHAKKLIEKDEKAIREGKAKEPNKETKSK
jgi:hypothetical protein